MEFDETYCKDCHNVLNAKLAEMGSVFCSPSCFNRWWEAQQRTKTRQQHMFDTLPMCVVELNYVDTQSKISAIKDARAAFGFGLHEAKAVVELKSAGKDVFFRCALPTTESCDCDCISFEVLKVDK